MRGVRKRFGGTVALDGVDLDVRSGEIHALLGENGAGKSTLMKILAGAIRPDAGSITLEGRRFAPRTPIEGRDAGVAMIYQELTLAPHLTVEQNLLLGRERNVPRSAARAALQALGARIELSTRVSELPPADRQLVEIARSLVGNARIVVLDEPTSSLGRAESQRVFAAMRQLRSLDRGVVFISHHLDEVRAVADCYTVLRDGHTVVSGKVADTSDDELIERMAGRPVSQLFPPHTRLPGEVVLRIDQLVGMHAPIEASLQLRRGEVLGIAGLVGAGRTEFLRAFFRLDPVRSGTVTLGGWSGTASRGSPRSRLAAGVGLLSEDRKREGLALRLPLATNAMMSSLEGLVVRGILRRSTLAERTTRWFERLGIKARNPWQLANELSGGNQQKVAIARLLERDVDVLLLDEPTRGIDVGSKSQIYSLLNELAAAGKAIVVVSSVTSELLGICDRIAVMCRGRLGAARDASDWDEESILRVASGVAMSASEGEAA